MPVQGYLQGVVVGVITCGLNTPLSVNGQVQRGCAWDRSSESVPPGKLVRDRYWSLGAGRRVQLTEPDLAGPSIVCRSSRIRTGRHACIIKAVRALLVTSDISYVSHGKNCGFVELPLHGQVEVGRPGRSELRILAVEAQTDGKEGRHGQPGGKTSGPERWRRIRERIDEAAGGVHGRCDGNKRRCKGGGTAGSSRSAG